MNSWKLKALWGTWVVSFALALVSMGVFVQGVFRDNRLDQPVIQIDLSTVTDWVSVPFRVRGKDT